jgi:hypothetical protein
MRSRLCSTEESRLSTLQRAMVNLPRRTSFELVQRPPRVSSNPPLPQSTGLKDRWSQLAETVWSMGCSQTQVYERAVERCSL